MSKYLGKMYLSKRPCGKVVAATWIDGAVRKKSLSPLLDGSSVETQ